MFSYYHTLDVQYPCIPLTPVTQVSSHLPEHASALTLASQNRYNSVEHMY